MWALARADLFNMLVIPPILPPTATTDRFLSGTAKNNAAGFCFDQRAFFLVDPYPGLEAPGRPDHRAGLR